MRAFSSIRCAFLRSRVRRECQRRHKEVSRSNQQRCSSSSSDRVLLESYRTMSYFGNHLHWFSFRKLSWLLCVHGRCCQCVSVSQFHRTNQSRVGGRSPRHRQLETIGHDNSRHVYNFRRYHRVSLVELYASVTPCRRNEASSRCVNHRTLMFTQG